MKPSVQVKFQPTVKLNRRPVNGRGT